MLASHTSQQQWLQCRKLVTCLLWKGVDSGLPALPAQPLLSRRKHRQRSTVGAAAFLKAERELSKPDVEQQQTGLDLRTGIDSAKAEGGDKSGKLTTVYNDYQELDASWGPIERKLRQRKEITSEECMAFGKQMLHLLDKFGRWRGACVAVVLYRLAVLRRETRRPLPQECIAVFTELLRRVGRASKFMNTQSMAMSVWSIATLSLLEEYRMPAPPSPPQSPKTKSGAQKRGRRRRSKLDANSQETMEKGSTGLGTARSGEHSTAVTEPEFQPGSRRELQEPPSSREASETPATTSSAPPASASGRQQGLEAPSVAENGRSQASTSIGSYQTANVDESPVEVVEDNSTHATTQSAGSHLLIKKPTVRNRDQHARKPLQLKTMKELSPKTHKRLNRLSNHWLQKQEEATLAGLFMLVWGFSKMGVSPLQGKLFRDVQPRAVEMAPEMQDHHIAQLLRAYSSLQEPVEAPLFEALSRRILKLAKGKTMTSISIVFILQSVSRMREADPSLSSHLFDVLLHKLIERNDQPLKTLTADNMAGLIMAVASAQHPVSTEFIDRWGMQVLRRLPEYRPWEAESIAWACQELKVDPVGGNLLHALYWRHAGLQDLVGMRRQAVAARSNEQGVQRELSENIAFRAE